MNPASRIGPLALLSCLLAAPVLAEYIRNTGGGERVVLAASVRF